MRQENDVQQNTLYSTLARAIYLAAGVFLALWFLNAITLALLFITVAVILAFALNPPVVWLENKGAPRVAGTLLVLLGVLGITAFLGWLVVPRLNSQISGLVGQAPDYANSLSERATQWLGEYPQLEQQLPIEDGELNSDATQQIWPTVQTLLSRVGRYSVSAIGAVVFVLLLFSTVLYTLAQPRPLLRAYIHIFPPPLRERAERALAKSAQSVSGWLWSNVIVGAIEAIAAGLFLSYLGVPGALVWATLTFFAELVPQVGVYLMAIPPILVALADDPMKALWVALFYIVLTQVVGTFIAPLVRSRQMQLHPVSLIFAVLAFGSVFGVLGALIATPLTGFIKAYYDEFYAARMPEDEEQKQRVENILTQRVE